MVSRSCRFSPKMNNLQTQKLRVGFEDTYTVSKLQMLICARIYFRCQQNPTKDNLSTWTYSRFACNFTTTVTIGSDQIGNCLIKIEIANHANGHFKLKSELYHKSYRRPMWRFLPLFKWSHKVLTIKPRWHAHMDTSSISL